MVKELDSRGIEFPNVDDLVRDIYEIPTRFREIFKCTYCRHYYYSIEEANKCCKEKKEMFSRIMGE